MVQAHTRMNIQNTCAKIQAPPSTLAGWVWRLRELIRCKVQRVLCYQDTTQAGPGQVCVGGGFCGIYIQRAYRISFF